MNRIRNHVTYPPPRESDAPMREDKFWTQACDDYVVRWWNLRPQALIAATLGYDISTVKRHAKMLGLS